MTNVKMSTVNVHHAYVLNVIAQKCLAQNHMIHTNELYRSPPNSGFWCRITPTDKFYLYRREILIKSGFSDGDFLSKTDNFPQNRVTDDNLIIFCVQSDCTGVKMCDNTFSHGFRRDCVVIEDVRAPKWWKWVWKSSKTTL